jgi:hypothetical protein
MINGVEQIMHKKWSSTNLGRISQSVKRGMKLQRIEINRNHK